MEEYSRIVIEEYCRTHRKTKKSAFLSFRMKWAISWSGLPTGFAMDMAEALSAARRTGTTSTYWYLFPRRYVFPILYGILKHNSRRRCMRIRNTAYMCRNSFLEMHLFGPVPISLLQQAVCRWRPSGHI